MFELHYHTGKRVMAILLVFAMMFAMLGEYAPSWFTAFALERSGNRGSSISEGAASGSRGSSRSSRSSSRRSGRSHARSSSSGSRTSKSGSDSPDSSGSQLFSSSSGRANRYDSDRSVRSYAYGSPSGRCRRFSVSGASDRNEIPLSDNTAVEGSASEEISDDASEKPTVSQEDTGSEDEQIGGPVENVEETSEGENTSGASGVSETSEGSAADDASSVVEGSSEYTETEQTEGDKEEETTSDETETEQTEVGTEDGTSSEEAAPVENESEAAADGPGDVLALTTAVAPAVENSEPAKDEVEGSESKPMFTTQAYTAPVMLAVAGAEEKKVCVLQQKIDDAMASVTGILSGKVKVVLEKDTAYGGEVSVEKGEREVAEDFELEIEAEDAGDDGQQADGKTTFTGTMSMANLETAYVINEYANWMVASEELVAGKGTAIDTWLQNLILMPECDGEKLGRWICDMTQIKYANEDNESARQLMTWSVIDLSKIKRLAYYQDILFRAIRLAYEKSPETLTETAMKTFHTEHYGSGHDNMWDLAGVFYSNADNTLLGSKTCWEMLSALMDAVVYNVCGSGRAAARGISFCYAADFTPEELDAYARNCPSANYLSLMDAISPWTAPDWVYEKVTRLPEMDTIDAYKVKVYHVVMEDGTPSFYLDEGSDINVGTVRFTMYRKNPVTRKVVSLGTAPAYYDTQIDPRGVYHVPIIGEWPALDGDICEIEAVSIPLDGDYNTLYNIPIRMDNDTWNLRCSFSASNHSHTVYGLWEGFDSDSTMFNRNVRELSQVNGREYNLLYRIDGQAGYEQSAPKTMYRRLTVENVPLPVGTYYMEYVIYDVFMRPMKLKRVELYWDGQRMTIPNDDWAGKETLSAADYYKTRK